MRRELLGYLLALSAVGFAKGQYDKSQRRIGALTEQLRAVDSARVALEARRRVTDTVYRTDTLRLTRRLTQWDTVLRSVATIPDTVRVPVEVVRWVASQADSTIRSCRIVQQTCEQRVAERDTLLALRERQLQIVKAQRPGLLKRLSPVVAGIGIGVLLTR